MRKVKWDNAAPVKQTVSELMLKTDVDKQSTLKAANYKSLSMLTKSTLQFLGCEVNQLSTRREFNVDRSLQLIDF